MINDDFFMTDTLIEITGWTLLHFLWQGMLVAVLAAFALSLCRHRSANLRYMISTAALILMLCAPFATAAYLRTNAGRQSAEFQRAVSQEKPHSENFDGLALTENAPLSASAGDAFPTSGLATSWLSGRRVVALFPLIVLVWCAGVSVLLVRLLGGWLMTERLKRRHVAPAPDEWQRILSALARRVGLSRPVRFCQSAFVSAPAAIGCWRPVILIPAGAFVGLSAPHLEAILLHELAHIKRHDHLINFIQALAETLLFYHPAVWWLSSRIRIEREHACDDLAVSASGDVLVYARALTEIEELRQAWTPQFVMGARGHHNNGSLLARITRLVGVASPPERAPSLLVASMILIGLSTVLVSAQTFWKKTHVPVNTGEPRRTEPLSPVTPASFGVSELAHGLSQSNEMSALIARDRTDGEDAEVRRAALAALGGNAGSVIVMDPRTGCVQTIVNQEWALRRGWTPASTIKLITGMAGVNEKLLDPAQKIRVSDRAQALNLTDALAYSNTEYFKQVGEHLGGERLLAYAKQFGLGEATGINYPDEIAGRLPATNVSATRLGGFGDQVEITPIQLGVLVSAIANGGKVVVPHVDRDTNKCQIQVRKQIDISAEAMQKIVSGMIGAVNYGTAQQAKNDGFQIAGKTGSGDDQGAPLGLFASYAPADNPRFVVVVITRGEKDRGPFASRIAGRIYRDLAKRVTTSE